MMKEVIQKRTTEWAGGQENGFVDVVPVDENLFTGDDLDELEEELNSRGILIKK